MAWEEWEASVHLPVIHQYLVMEVLWPRNMFAQVRDWVYSLLLLTTWKQIPNNRCFVYIGHKEAAWQVAQGCTRAHTWLSNLNPFKQYVIAS